MGLQACGLVHMRPHKGCVDTLLACRSMWHNVINMGGFHQGEERGPGPERGGEGADFWPFWGGDLSKRYGEAGGSIWAKYLGKQGHGDSIQAIFCVLWKFFKMMHDDHT